MEADFEDTVLVPSRPRPTMDDGVDEDTVVPHRWAEPALVAPYPVPIAARHEVQQLPPAPPATTALNQRSATKQVERRSPSLVEPTPAKPRRVPLTHKRLQETLRAPQAAYEPSVLSALQSAAAVVVAPVFGFRLGERAPISLDVPALVGRHPAAPRIPGKVFPRLVRVPSALSEVSSTHLELRQDGASVIVTDLRSTNGTVVRMPGSRPIKLRQGESLVVRPGTLVDIGDGNVIEILSPPRLGLPADAAGDGRWL